jgi:glycosyltransferase involved in cell wall biosynthesis
VIAVLYPGEKFLRALEWVGLQNDGWHLGSIRALARLALDNVDVVHVHNLHGGWMSIRAVKRLCERVPTVWTLHDEWAPSGGLAYDLARVMDEETLRRWFGPQPVLSSRDPRWRQFLDGGIPRPQAVVAPSRYMAELVQGSGRFEGVPIHTIPYGVTMLRSSEVEADRSSCRQELGLARDARVVLLVAAHFTNPFKGIPLASAALSRLRDFGVTVLVVGNGGEDIAAAAGLPAVCTGFIADEGRLARVYRAADVTLIPSIADNFPYVALESMVCGTPAVAFRVGGLTEMLGEGERGLLTAPFDVANLASNVKTLLDSAELRARLGAAGRAWTSGHCDMGRYLARHIELYQQVYDNFHRAQGQRTVQSGRTVEASR